MRYHRPRASGAHKNPNGNWCHCPFGDPTKEPYVSPSQQERFGKIVEQSTMWKEAAKLPWLRERSDDPQYQRLLDRLELTYPDHDALYPWLVREHKKGRLTDPYSHAVNQRWPVDHRYFGDDDIPFFRNPFHYTAHDGRPGRLETDDLDQVQDWMKYQKQAGKGVDIMKQEIGPAVDQAQRSDIGGDIVHSFDAPYDGWNMVRLRNKRDMVQEGSRMNHCVGSNGMGYIEKNDEGRGLYYSLRDPRNDSVATLEMTPKGNHYYMCPECGKPTFGYLRGNGGGTALTCEHCNHHLGSTDYPVYSVRDFPTENLAEGVKPIPTITSKSHARPTADHMEPAQLFGHSDQRLTPEYEGLVNDWLGPLGHDHMESDGEEEEEEEEYEPWWDSYYDAPGADTVQSFFDHQNGDYEDYAPEEYHRAVQDAYHNDLEPPELSVGSPDIPSIFEDMTHNVDPHQIRDLWKGMHDEGYGDEWREQVHDWLNGEYKPWLDPYGKEDGPGHDLHSQGEPATLPSGHYPTSHPEEEYLARNLMYHLDQMRDPQTGTIPDDDRLQDYGMPSMQQRYPAITPMDPPRPPDPPGDQQQGGNLFQQRLQDSSGGLSDIGVDTEVRRQRRREGIPPADRAGLPEPPSEPWYPQVPKTPDEAFGAPDTRFHQRALPGMPNPTNLDMYGQGQQQGRLWPQPWYIDYAKQRAKETELPPELFPPNRFGYHEASREPSTPMWGDSRTGEGSTLNTHEDLSRGDLSPEYQGGTVHGLTPITSPQYLPRVQWQAKTAGPWTEYEDEQKQQVEPHRGVPDMEGHVVETNIPHYMEMPDFAWRRPVVYDRAADRMIVGQPSMEHRDMMEHMGLPSPWLNGNPHPHYIPGYIDTDGHVQQGLDFFAGGSQIRNVDRFHDWVENRFGVRNQNTGPQHLQNEDWISSKVSWVEQDHGHDGPQYDEDVRLDPDATWMDGYLRRMRPLKEEWLKNPDPLKWNAGQDAGKGFMDEDGLVHTWDEGSSVDPGWMHSSQAEIRGVKNDFATHIYMQPETRFSPPMVDDRYSVGSKYPEKAAEMLRQMRERYPTLLWRGVNAAPPKQEEQEPEEEFGDDLWKDSSYHPSQDDEWAADDEPVFSAIIPESRWGG